MSKSFVINTTFEVAKTIDTSRCRLELSTDRKDFDDALALKIKNIEGGYLDFLYERITQGGSPDKTTVNNEHGIAFCNGWIKHEEGKISGTHLYYVVKLKETNEIIGEILIGKNAELRKYMDDKELFDIFDRDLELAYFIDKAHSNQGYGYEAVSACINFLKQYSDAKRIACSARSPNVASCKLLKKCGFIHRTEYKTNQATQWAYFYLDL